MWQWQTHVSLLAEAAARQHGWHDHSPPLSGGHSLLQAWLAAGRKASQTNYSTLTIQISSDPLNSC